MSMMAPEQDPRAMALMQAAMGGGAPAEQPMGGGDEEMQEGDLIESALDSIGQALGLRTVSQQERLLLEQATTILQKLLAQREREEEQAMGGGGAMRVLQRQGMAA